MKGQIEVSMRGYSNPSIYNDISKFGIDSLSIFLNKEYGFTIVDFRNKDKIFLEKQLSVFRNTQKIAIIYSLDLRGELYSLLQWFSEYNVINFKSTHPNSEEIKLSKFVRIITLINSKDIEIIKKDKPTYFRKISPIVYSFIE